MWQTASRVHRLSARHDEKKNRTTTFWLAPKLGYLPVQMRQTEPGKATISLVLTEIKFEQLQSRYGLTQDLMRGSPTE